MKAILAALKRPLPLDMVALDQLMTTWAPVSPRTVFHGVREVQPGEMLILRRGKLAIRRKDDDFALPYRENDDDELEEIPFRNIDLVGPRSMRRALLGSKVRRRAPELLAERLREVTAAGIADPGGNAIDRDVADLQ